jgi:hypothetical protein
VSRTAVYRRSKPPCRFDVLALLVSIGSRASYTHMPMHEQHPVFEAPSNPDVSIWRYMDLAKFLSMLEAGALHFARADLMLDEFEGSISKPAFEYRRQFLGDTRDEDFEQFYAQWASAMEKIRYYNYLSCWHMNEHESAAMWAIYQSGEPRGIAVRSTYRRLSKSIVDQRTVYIGKVSYIDFSAEEMPVNNALYPYVHKRRSFEYEREIRALYPFREFVEDETKSNTAEYLAPSPPVVPISVDLNRLIEAVYLSPKAPVWFAELIRKLLQRYGRSWTVHHSSLDADPIF